MNPTDFLHGIDVVEIIDSGRPIRQIKSGVIGLVGTAGKGPTNDSTLILGNPRDAVAIFGENKNDGFTLPAALEAIFDQGSATVVVVNAASATDHTTDVNDETIVLDGNDGQLAHGYVTSVVPSGTYRAPYLATVNATITLPTGATRTAIRNATDTADVLLANVLAGTTYIVTYTASLSAGTDYFLDAEDGTITRATTGSKLLPNSSMIFDYTYVDPTQVTDDDIIGSDADGALTGMQQLREAKQKVFVQPYIILAPGFVEAKPVPTTANPVASALQTLVTTYLRGVGVANTPNTTKEDAVAYATDFAGSDRMYCLFPFVRILNPIGDGTIIAEPSAARVAGLMAKVANDEGFWVSPSNHVLLGILGLDKAIDFDLRSTSTVANYLNANYVTTIVQEQGFRLWGNRVADGTFINGRVIRDMVGNSIVANQLYAVDRNITKGYVEAIIEGVKNYLRDLMAFGAILGGTAWADPTLNTPTVLSTGELFIDFDLTLPSPAEHLIFREHITDKYLTSIFDVNVPVA